MSSMAGSRWARAHDQSLSCRFLKVATHPELPDLVVLEVGVAELSDGRPLGAERARGRCLRTGRSVVIHPVRATGKPDVRRMRCVCGTRSLVWQSDLAAGARQRLGGGSRDRGLPTALDDWTIAERRD